MRHLPMNWLRWAMLFSAALLAGCLDKEEPMIEASSQTCTPQFWKTLAEGKRRDDLVERCMTRGGYKHSVPQTF
ncbi:entry exclusion lipoprotein TrbK [Pseudomonas sp. NPDC089401]|uniref:entry exclusion lipoprotein TrbK n=1 Tax=Pseudomonas sp. NPDC089401 TaxID=3364462 RepID=UPI003821243B